MEGRRDDSEPETINVWELMSGLDDDDSLPRPFPAIPASKSTAAIPAATLAAKLFSDPFTLEPTNERPAKPPWQASLKVDGPHPRSPIHTVEYPIPLMPTFRRSSTDFNPLYTSSSHKSSLFGSILGSNMPSFEHISDNLQRSLSFKLVFDKESKGIMGLEDTDEFFNDDLPISTNEGDPGTRSESPSFSASAKLMKWIKANKRALKLRDAMKGRRTKAHEAVEQVKKPSPPPQSAASSTLRPPPPPRKKHTISASKVGDGMSTVKPGEGGSSCKPSVGSSIGKGNDDVAEPNGDSARIFLMSDGGRSREAPRGGSVRRRYRHSYSSGSMNERPTEETVGASTNRPSSWELEKVAVDSAGKAVLYSTSSRADMNAYEDSNAVRAILISIVGPSFDEKSVSQNPDYEQELKSALNLRVVTVPVVRLRGRCIAGIDNIMHLFKKGIMWSLLLETLPHGLKPIAPCLCRGGKFLICPICKGKRKLTREGEEPVSCRHCIGTGILKCPSCPKP